MKKTEEMLHTYFQKQGAKSTIETNDMTLDEVDTFITETVQDTRREEDIDTVQDRRCVQDKTAGQDTRVEENTAANISQSMRKTILLAELELQNRHKTKRVGFGRFLLEQMRMMGMRIWMVQIGAVLLAYLLLHLMTAMEFQYFTAKSYAFLTGVIGILIFSAAIPFLYRAQRYKMLEIEASAKYSVGELVLSRILIFGVGDILMLFGIVWQISKISPLTVLQTTFCLCLPFLLAVNGGIYLLRKVTFVHFQKWAYGMCAAMCGIFAGITFLYPAYYEMKFTFLVSCITLFLIGGLVYQCFTLFLGNTQVVYD